jgi:hypothetical protein
LPRIARIDDAHVSSDSRAPHGVQEAPRSHVSSSRSGPALLFHLAIDGLLARRLSNPSKEQHMTNTIRLLVAALALAAGAAQAQSSPTEKGTGHEAGGRWGKNYTPGWAMMSAKERKEYQTKIGAIHGQSECKAFIDQTTQQMAERAKSKGVAAPAAPARDACAKLKQ